MELKDSLRKLRNIRGITQEGAAESLGVSAQTVSKWERGLCTPDANLLPRIATLYGCTVDRLFGMDNTETSFTSILEESVLQLESVEDFGGVFSLYLTECEARRDDFSLLDRTLLYVCRYSLFNHPELPRILPLIRYCECYCSDRDLLNRVLSYGLYIAGHSDIPSLREKAREYYHRLPSHLYGRERYILSVMEGEELRRNLQENVRHYASETISFLYHLAQNSEKPEEQLRLLRITTKIYEVLSEGKTCGKYDGILLNAYHKLAWKYMQLGRGEDAEACVDAILRRLQLHLTEDGRKNVSDLLRVGFDRADRTVLPLLHRMEHHPDLLPFRERITAFREEYEAGIQAFKKEHYGFFV